MFDFSDVVVRQLSESIHTPLLTYDTDIWVRQCCSQRRYPQDYHHRILQTGQGIPNTVGWHYHFFILHQTFVYLSTTGQRLVLVVVFGNSLGVSNGSILRVVVLRTHWRVVRSN